jgi:hypothetical protein
MLRDKGKDFPPVRLPIVKQSRPAFYYFFSTTLMVSVELSLA